MNKKHHWYKYLTGFKVGKLTVLELLPKTEDETYKGRKWKCLCDCGNIKISYSNKLLSGRLKSCGCLTKELNRKLNEGLKLYNRERRRPQYEMFWDTYIKTYKRAAKDRKLHWLLSDEYAKELANKPCFYCDAEPVENLSLFNTYMRASKIDNYSVDLEFAKTKIFLSNGIDRIDNDVGYTVENSVTCCKHCNYAKRNRSLEEFKDWINQVHFNINKVG